ncbi:histidine phosphatase family protein [Actinomycetaceae bacterium TAE3-ERU4]|nr:histidine phosphatase family protein [Actinomycetaceae bacterium TAE3-ERU4]
MEENVIVLVRHATAQNYGAQGDVSRELTSGGHKQAESLGHLLSQVIPQGVEALYVSHATRAQQTADEIEKSLPCLRRFEDGAIYEFSVESLREILHACPYRSLMIVGHEPAISGFAACLLSEEYPQRYMIDGGVPTGTAIVLRTDENFANVASGSCELVELINSPLK